MTDTPSTPSTSMLPAETLDINVEFNLPAETTERYWIRYFPLAWLPYEAAMKYEAYANVSSKRVQDAEASGNLAGSMPTAEEETMMGEVLDLIVESWHLTDRRGAPIPSLVDDPQAWKKVPMNITNKLMQLAQEGAEIPPQSGKPSSDGSTPLTLPVPPMPEQAMERAQEQASHLG